MEELANKNIRLHAQIDTSNLTRVNISIQVYPLSRCP